MLKKTMFVLLLVLSLPLVSSEFKRPKPKRKQIKMACTNCQKRHTKCDEGNPCQWCFKNDKYCMRLPTKRRREKIDYNPYNLLYKNNDSNNIKFFQLPEETQ